MIVVRLRQGIGIDIEYNEDICHMVETEDEKTMLLAFTGAIVMLPFIKVYVGTFEELAEFQ
jgi:hypothetical protein